MLPHSSLPGAAVFSLFPVGLFSWPTFLSFFAFFAPPPNKALRPPLTFTDAMSRTEVVLCPAYWEGEWCGSLTQTQDDSGFSRPSRKRLRLYQCGTSFLYAAVLLTPTVCRTAPSGEWPSRHPAKRQGPGGQNVVAGPPPPEGGRNESSNKEALLKDQVNKGQEGLKRFLGKTEREKNPQTHP